MNKEQTEFCKSIGEQFMVARSMLKDEDFVVNPAKMFKFNKVVSYAKTLADENGGTIAYCNKIPRDTIGAIAIRFVGEITFGAETASMSAFNEAIEICDGFNIEGTGLDDASFIITFYVTDIHVKNA